MKPRSLKARAIDYLSRREHSRHELARKLARFAEQPDEVEDVLQDLERQGLISNERFAASLVNRKSARLGTARIVQELRQHGVSVEDINQVQGELKDSELERARMVWQKRYGAAGVAQDATERARQMRFLAGRGFSHDIIRKVVNQP